MLKIYRVIKKVNKIGRIQIPFEMRKKANLVEENKLEIYIKKGNMIVVEKYKDKNKINGIIRTIDELGRIILPIDIRKELKIEEDSQLEICLENNTIILKKVG